jgi:mannose-1-phosphate guanylyltransferase
VKPWAVILAGGDGTRLRALTRRISGDDRPKQFCAVLGGASLLELTRRRAAQLINPNHTLYLLTETHERFYRSLSNTTPARALVVQPENRGTAPAILLAARRLVALGAREPVALLPSDHHVSDDAAFMAHVGDAIDMVAACPDLVVLLGVEAASPETEYGWIEPGPSVVTPWSGRLRHVRRFIEKPDHASAASLFRSGALWNCFVVVARPKRLLALFAETVPTLVDWLAPVGAAIEPEQSAQLKYFYAGLPVMDFSRTVLAAAPEALAVLPVKGVEWSDLGNPARVDALFHARRAEPPLTRIKRSTQAPPGVS